MNSPDISDPFYQIVDIYQPEQLFVKDKAEVTAKMKIAVNGYQLTLPGGIYQR